MSDALLLQILVLVALCGFVLVEGLALGFVLWTLVFGELRRWWRRKRNRCRRCGQPASAPNCKPGGHHAR